MNITDYQNNGELADSSPDMLLNNNSIANTMDVTYYKCYVNLF